MDTVKFAEKMLKNIFNNLRISRENYKSHEYKTLAKSSREYISLIDRVKIEEINFMNDLVDFYNREITFLEIWIEKALSNRNFKDHFILSNVYVDLVRNKEYLESLILKFNRKIVERKSLPQNK
ncbi:hypothetical protein [uncultured Metabacillus sp.]|uniref:hypothetical protein n=1 Tax=uncultured Metabacillus sp. TaxID=2860135 RepID=UPI002607211F|nr:hypothetical protein [uncultured Metabacillus sp.]